MKNKENPSERRIFRFPHPSFRHCVLSHPSNVFMLAELAEIPLLLEELRMMMLAIESVLMCNIIRRADDTASMGALETSPMV